MAATSVWVLRVNASHLLPLWELVQEQQVCLTRTPFKWLLLPWVPAHVRFCGSPLRVEFLFSTTLWLSWNKPCWPFKAKCSGGSSSQCRTPGLGTQCEAQIPRFSGTTSATVIILLFVGHPPQDSGSWLYCSSSLPTHLSVVSSFYL